VDGFFRTVLRGRLQPLEIARSLTRQAEEEKIISLSRVFVPNRYVVGLHPEDMATLESVAPELEAEFQRFVGEWVAERDYTVTGPIRVKLAAQERVGRGRMRISCGHEGRPQEEEETPTAVGRHLLAEDAVGKLEVAEGPDAGRKFPLYPGRTLLGRGVDCDVVLQDTLVSRHHAALEPRDDGWWVTDLDSTNGTLVNDESVYETKLASGDRLQVGDTVFKLKLEELE
jgi:hypothetical protein